ncbi:MAG: CsbD family protein [Pseudoxanthomonas suwonensis]|nr:CsbD family protein [Pseudoxanthomonas suwonensis]
MNKDIIAGNWQQLKGKAQSQWGKLTDDVFDVAEGNREYLSGKLQEQYGWTRERTEDEINAFERQFEKH